MERAAPKHDFAKIVEIFDAQRVSFVSVTQAFNTTTSMGRLTLNVLLSFAQFEREVTGERIRDKIAASKKKGMWMGGQPALGYGLLSIHSRCGPHTRAVTSYTEGFSHFVTSHDCSGCFRLERLPGGACTHWKAPPSHGAHVDEQASRATEQGARLGGEEDPAPYAASPEPTGLRLGAVE